MEMKYGDTNILLNPPVHSRWILNYDPNHEMLKRNPSVDYMLQQKKEKKS